MTRQTKPFDRTLEPSELVVSDSDEPEGQAEDDAAAEPATSKNEASRPESFIQEGAGW